MENFQKLIQAQFDKMCATGKLFRSALTGHELWKLYLASFPEGKDPQFRDPESTEHNCQHCNNFIKRYGNIVAIGADGQLMTMFDVIADDEYRETAHSMSSVLHAQPIADVFFETYEELNDLPYESCSKTSEIFRLGTALNRKRYTADEAKLYGVVKPNEVRTFNHFFLDLPKAFVDTSGKSEATIRENYRSAKEVFARFMIEVSGDTTQLVLDLINQGSILNAEEYKSKLEKMIELQKVFALLPPDMRDNWFWLASFKLPFAKFKNELMGTLCTELAEGMELNKACLNWNIRADKDNYMRAVAPFTESQKQAAIKTVDELGYTASFQRRLATANDIMASEICHTSAESGEVASATMFDAISAPTRHKRAEFNGIPEISITDFMANVLPHSTSVEAYLENGHTGNMVTMTQATTIDSKPMFKWDNNFSWSFSGNLAGKSEIKQAVKDAGGNVTGVLNFRLAWNDGDGRDGSDLDAWASEPNGTRIGYNSGFRKDRNDQRTSMQGQLDVDNMNPHGKMAVENITWLNKGAMKDGTFRLWVNQYSNNSSQGFKAEIDIDGETYSYTYDKPVYDGENILVADVTLKDGVFTIKHHLPETNASKKIYGLDTNHFHKVNLMCLSPNHWGDNEVGTKHYFFMMDGCKTESPVKGYHAENLNADLVEHRRVLEPLAATMMISPEGKQLSGLGFNATVHDALIVKVKGSHERTLKIKF